MKIVESWPQVDGAVRYLLRDGHGKIMVDVKDKEMTGFTRHGHKGDEDKVLKKAFKFLESKERAHVACAACSSELGSINFINPRNHDPCLAAELIIPHHCQCLIRK
jgi:hypothetical protein